MKKLLLTILFLLVLIPSCKKDEEVKPCPTVDECIELRQNALIVFETEGQQMLQEMIADTNVTLEPFFELQRECVDHVLLHGCDTTGMAQEMHDIMFE